MVAGVRCSALASRHPGAALAESILVGLAASLTLTGLFRLFDITNRASLALALLAGLCIPAARAASLVWAMPRLHPSKRAVAAGAGAAGLAALALAYVPDTSWDEWPITSRPYCGWRPGGIPFLVPMFLVGYCMRPGSMSRDYRQMHRSLRLIMSEAQLRWPKLPKRSISRSLARTQVNLGLRAASLGRWFDALWLCSSALCAANRALSLMPGHGCGIPEPDR